MNEFRARIGRVRMKNGGADVRVLNREAQNIGDENWRGTIVRNARAMAEMPQEMTGYVIVGIYGGATSVAYRYDPDGCSIPRALFPAWLSEIIRRDMIVAPEARDVFHEMFKWREG